MLRRTEIAGHNRAFKIGIVRRRIVGSRVAEEHTSVCPRLGIYFLDNRCFGSSLRAMRGLLTRRPKLGVFYFMYCRSNTMNIGCLFSASTGCQGGRYLRTPGAGSHGSAHYGFSNVVVSGPAGFVPLLSISSCLGTYVSLDVLKASGRLMLGRGSSFRHSLLHEERRHVLSSLTRILGHERVRVGTTLGDAPTCSTFYLG